MIAKIENGTLNPSYDVVRRIYQILYSIEHRNQTKAHEIMSPVIFVETDASIKVEYQAGYTEANMPEDIKLACVNEVVRNYKNRFMSGDFGVTAISTPNGTNINLSALPLLEDSKMILDSYMY